jgi:hypothetical protein
MEETSNYKLVKASLGHSVRDVDIGSNLELIDAALKASADEIFALKAALLYGITTYYPLIENGGTIVKDYSQYSNDGILKNGPVWGINDGVVGLTFDGVDDYIEDSKGRHIVREV